MNGIIPNPPTIETTPDRAAPDPGAPISEEEEGPSGGWWAGELRLASPNELRFKRSPLIQIIPGIGITPAAVSNSKWVFVAWKPNLILVPLGNLVVMVNSD